MQQDIRVVGDILDADRLEGSRSNVIVYCARAVQDFASHRVLIDRHSSHLLPYFTSMSIILLKLCIVMR